MKPLQLASHLAFTLVLVPFLILSAAGRAQAQGLILTQPTHPMPNWQAPTIQSEKVGIQVTDGVAKVEVEQVFYNPNGVPAEGTYLFPLPAGAVVSHFRMLIDKEPTEGKLLSVEEARHVYESYVRRRVDPAILEYVGRNAFQARIFPIPPSSERHIYLWSSQPAEYSGGIYRLTYPLNSEKLSGSTLGELSIDCDIHNRQPIRSVYSPSHEIQVRRTGDTAAHVSFNGKDVRANKDFQLYISTSDRAFGMNVLTHRRPGEDGYLMLMLAPKRDVAPSEVLPKDVVVVFDTSGSMEGPKIEQAKKALETILGALNDGDRFNVLRFSTDVTKFRPSVAPANAENRAEARKFVEGFRAVGGTDIDEAMEQALASFPKPEERKGRSPFLIFMTDGLPTVGVTDIGQVLKDVDQAAPKDLRMFAFGVGADVNTLLLDRMARDHGGAADYVAEDEDLETRIGNFYAKISNPVLSNVHLSLAGATLLDPYPAHLPDLFAGTQLLVLARYKGDGKATVTLTGDLNGKPQKYSYDVSLPERELEQEFLPKLWAGRRIGFLLEEIRLHGENKELKDEVVRLSEEYRIVTPYTSYLVLEPGAALPPQALGVPLNPTFSNSVNGVPLLGGTVNSNGTGGGGGGRPASGGLGGGFGGFGAPSGLQGLGSGVSGPASGNATSFGFSDSQQSLALKPPKTAKTPAKPRPEQAKSVAGRPLGKDDEARSDAAYMQSESLKEATAQRSRKGAQTNDGLGTKAPFGTRAKTSDLYAHLPIAEPQIARKKQTPTSSPAPPNSNAVSNYAYQNNQAQQYRQQAEGFKRSTGWNSVEASRRVQQLKEKELADTDVEVIRSVEGRQFRFAEGGWKDQTVTAKMTVVHVQYGSDAYFALISAKPEWARFLALGHAVKFRTGRQTAVAVATTGKTKLSDTEVKALEK